VFGKANSSAIDLSAIADVSNPTGGFVINGEAAGDVSGNSVSSAGDVNGDGLDDLIVAASPLITKPPVGLFVSAITLRSMALLLALPNAGDVNGDGLDDLIVGAFFANSIAGKSYVVFGKANSSAINLSAITLPFGSAL
jgi:hypothetical protein